MASYEFWFTTENGTRHTLLDSHLGCTFTRVANEVGWLSMRLPESFDTDLIKLDRMVQVWRAPTGGRLSLYRTYFVRKWTYSTYENRQILEIAGPDFNDLLQRRINGYYANEAETVMTDEADDMMAAVVDLNMGAGGIGPRRMSRFSVATTDSAGPILEKAFAWRNVLKILQEINQSSREEGHEVFFDVTEDVSATTIAAEFHTYIRQPRQDLTGLGVLFAQYQGNLANPTLTFDYSEEANYVYGLGQGVNDLRTTVEVQDLDRVGQAPWNRREDIADARNCQTDNCVREAARARLAEGRPKERLTANLVDTDGCQFGRDWNWGDRVRATYRDFVFDCIVRAVTISLDAEGQETIDVQPEYRSV
jgi:hypothetical protein